MVRAPRKADKADRKSPPAHDSDYSRPFAMYLFSAAIFILREARSGVEIGFDWGQEVGQCLDYLRKAGSRNTVASQALKMLDEFILG